MEFLPFILMGVYRYSSSTRSSRTTTATGISYLLTAFPTEIPVASSYLLSIYSLGQRNGHCSGLVWAIIPKIV
jgi:hypothetical protein